MKLSKRILLVAPHYFNYDIIIKEHLEAKGYIVDLINDRPFDSNIFKAIIRINRSLINSFLYNYYKYEIFKKSAQDYQLIFVIQGEGLVPKFLKWLRVKYKKTPMIYYLWDSLSNKPKLKLNFPYFDRVITFDSIDSQRLNLDFAPLFFPPNLKKQNKNKYKYDLSFVGSLHGDRGLVIKLFKTHAPKLKFYIYLYSPSLWIFYVRRFFNKNFCNIDTKDLYFKQLPYDRVQKIFCQSKVILDIHSINQSGLTIRTLESLAFGKKIATTNLNVRGYDFYHPNNIFILDRNNLNIPISFFTSPFKCLSKKIINRYSLESFVDNTIGPYLIEK